MISPCADREIALQSHDAPTAPSVVVVGTRYACHEWPGYQQQSEMRVGVAVALLALYLSAPYLVLMLTIATALSPAARVVWLLLVPTLLLLPAGPLRWPRVLNSWMVKAWRQYFSYSYCFDFPLDPMQSYVLAQSPHGAYPLGQVLGASLLWDLEPGHPIFCLAASSTFWVPVWRQVNTWLGAQPATRRTFNRMLDAPLPPQAPPRIVWVQRDGGHTAPGASSPASAACNAAAIEAAAAAAAAAAAQGGGQHARRASMESELDGLVHLSLGPRSACKEEWQADVGSAPTCVAQPQLLEPPPAGKVSRPAPTAAAVSAARPLLRVRGTSSGGDGEAAPAASRSTPSQCSHPFSSTPSSPHGSACSSPPPRWRSRSAAAAVAAPAPPAPARSVAVIPGGIAEMYRIRPDAERIKLHSRLGFVRLAVQRGLPIVPTYFFGNTRALDFGPPWLQRLSRRLRVSFGLLYGRWGLPVPRRVPLYMAVGVPVPVGAPLPSSDPGFEARVAAVHAAVVAETVDLYHRHRERYGWGDRELIVD